MNFALAEQGRKDMIGVFRNTVAEPKIDGERSFMIKTGGQVSLVNRRGTNITMKFPDVAKAGAELPEGTVVDGEISCPSQEGKHNCPSTARRATVNQAKVNYLCEKYPAVFMAFDLLYLNNEDLRGKPFKDRRSLLQGLKGTIMRNSEGFILVPQMTDQHGAWQVWVEQEGGEGIMLKDLNASYSGRRSSAWIKVKAWAEKDFRVLSFTSQAREVSTLVLDNGHEVNCPRPEEGRVVKDALAQGKQVVAVVKYLPPYRFPILREVRV